MKRVRQAGVRGAGVRTGLARLLGQQQGRVPMSQSAQREVGWEVSARSETGYVRDDNQDRMTCIQVGEDRIYVVADGMGGHKGGGLAAELTVKSVETWFKSAPSSGSPPETIRRALEAANAAVDAKAHCGDPDTEGMGSTAVLVLTRKSIAYLGHVGDSRAYLYRGGALRQLTKDHSRVQRMVDAGMMTPAQARDHPEGSILERAIGQQPTVVVDTGPELQLQEGDGILLCSDGLSGYVDSGDILAVLQSGATVQEVSERLVERALDQGGYDNVTVQFIQYGQRAEALRRPKYRLRGLLAAVWAFVRGLYGERPAMAVPTPGASTGEQAVVSGERPTPPATATSDDKTSPAQPEVRGPQAIAEEGRGETAPRPCPCRAELPDEDGGDDMIPPNPPSSVPPPAELPDEDGGDDEVTCSAFSPRLAAPGDEILIQAYAHLPGQEEQVAAMAEDADLAASPRGSQRLAEPVARDTKLGFHLRMRGVEIDEPDIVRVWRGEPLTAQFGVFFPEDFQPRIVNATVQVTKDGVPIGHIKFTLQVVTRAEKQRADADAAGERLGTLSRYGEAFISYASKDREKVLPMVQALAAAKINVFQDLINLGPGDRWAKELYKHIDNSDAFFLFWSKAANESEWVMKEVLYAHGRQGGKEDAPPEIIPIIIEGPPPVKPPPELNFLHFNDKFIYLRKGVEVEARARDEAGCTDNP